MSMEVNGSAGAELIVPNLDDRVTDAEAVLKLLADGAGLKVDGTAIRQALDRAETEVPPTIPRAARQRLCQAAESLGLQILSRQLTTREAVRVAQDDAPLAIFSLSHAGTARWFALAESDGDLAHLAPVEPEDPIGWISADALARHIGARHADVVLEWFVAQPAPVMVDAEPAAEHAVHAETPHGPSPWRRLVGLLRPDWRDLLLVTIYAIGVGVLSLAIPITVMAVVNTTALSTLLQQLLVLCLALFVCLALAGVLRALQAIVVEFLQQRLFVRVASDLAYRLPRVELRAFDQQHGPELVNRFFDVLTVQKAGATLLLDGIAVVLQMSIGLTLLAFYHQFLLAFDLFLIVGLIAIVFLLGRGAVSSAIRESRAKYAVAAWVEELARLPLSFKGRGGAWLAADRTDRLARDYVLARQRHFRIVLRQFLFALLLQTLASTALLAVGGWLVIQGQLTLGQLVAAEIVVSLIVASFTKLGKQLESYYDLLAGVEKLGHLMDLPLERVGGATHAVRGYGAAVNVRNLSFTYGDNRPPTISNLSFEINPGDRVALVGRNGTGKSTLVDLLYGLREPGAGTIEIDGMDLRDLRLESVREQIAVVRGIQIVEGSTVVENVRIGRPDVSLSDVRQALMAVDLLDDVLRLPRGLQTELTASGSPLSLGQAERLMLARAIAGRPRLLILDESLDDMDRASRSAVLPAIFGPEAHWTVLVITHSEEVARVCTRRVRLDKARGGESGAAAAS